MRPAPLAALGVIGTIEGLAALDRHRARSDLYDMAKRRAAELRRPLLVVGAPGAGAHTALVHAYGCGDECIDLHGCPECPVQSSVDITEPIDLPDDSRVVFVSCVLEYVDDFNAAWSEICRVAGGKENVFVAIVQPWTLTGSLYPGATWSLQNVASEGRPQYVASEVSPARKFVSFGLVAGLIAWSLWPTG